MIEILTRDGTYTLKSEKYNECYHSSEGALKESLYKHVLPALEIVKKDKIKILDICFGLGYNTFATIISAKNKNIEIYSPELDEDLIRKLKDFKYPKEFEKIKHIIEAVSKNHYYEDERVKIHISINSARKFIKNLPKVDIIYQDPFSPKVNKELWTFEYFRDIKKILNKDGVITTYSVATPVRCALYKLGFYLYTHKSDKIRKGTIATLKEIDYPRVDFEEKLKRIKCYYLKDSDENN
jgi:tRNA U34 5-methylaminomethyl-2-thiouridine-forming methyltransferase MnmC